MPGTRHVRLRAICRRAGIAAAAVALAAGCGTNPVSTSEAGASRSPSTAAEQVLRLPDRLPPQLPAPPAGARIVATAVEERALLGQDMAVEHGTVVQTGVEYELGWGDRRRVLDHYRREAPASGWQIVADEPRSAESGDPGGHVLRVQGHGHSQVTLLVQEADPTTLLITAIDIVAGRKPSEHLPLVALPGWYEALPEPAPGSRRYEVRVTTGIGEATTYQLQYEPDPQHGNDNQHLTAAVLADHYQRRMPRNGWTVDQVRERTERPGKQGGVIEHLHVSAEFSGHGVAGEIVATQTVSAAGQWLGSRVSLTITPFGAEATS